MINWVLLSSLSVDQFVPKTTDDQVLYVQAPLEDPLRQSVAKMVLQVFAAERVWVA